MTEQDSQSWLKQGASLSTEDIRRHYDDWAQTYDETLRSWGYRAPEEAAAMLGTRLAAEAALFDAGCGTGLSGHALRERGFTGRIDGADLSEESVALARARGIYDSVAVTNFNALPLAQETDRYDATVCIGVLTYVGDVAGLLREFCRITRPGGYVLVTHRDDLVAEQDFVTLTNSLARDGIMETVEITEPRPYLPQNPDFGDSIRVVYALFRVR